MKSMSRNYHVSCKSFDLKIGSKHVIRLPFSVDRFCLVSFSQCVPDNFSLYYRSDVLKVQLGPVRAENGIVLLTRVDWSPAIVDPTYEGLAVLTFLIRAGLWVSG